MLQTLLTLARQLADSSGDELCVATTPVAWLRVLRTTAARPVSNLISRPTICLVLQGKVRQTLANNVSDIVAGDSLLLTNGTPALTEVTGASIAEPCLALLIEIDLATISSLIVDMEAANAPFGGTPAASNTIEEVVTTAVQLVRLLQQSASMDMLIDPLARALHYWLLAGKHGDGIRGLAKPDNTIRRVARAIATIRSDFAKPLPIDRLAAVAGMSSSAFHQHFRSATSMTPLQYQKQIRLTEARRMMLSGGVKASSAAFSVGYQSISQFTRDYRRMFGLPPVRDASHARAMGALNRLRCSSLDAVTA
jgi:AraC-like DNA-binding protein